MSGETEPREPETLPEPIVEWQPNHHRMTTQATGGLILGAALFGALAMGAFAIGAMAIGSLAVGRMRIGRLEVDHLVVRRSSGAA
jgi:hypothetical protein